VLVATSIRKLGSTSARRPPCGADHRLRCRTGRLDPGLGRALVIPAGGACGRTPEVLCRHRLRKPPPCPADVAVAPPDVGVRAVR
jgi:hypothetical protein